MTLPVGSSVSPEKPAPDRRSWPLARLGFTHGVGVVLAAGMFVAGLLRYHSVEHPIVLDRWSLPFYTASCAVVLGLVCVIIVTVHWRRSRRPQAPPVPHVLVDVAALCWSAAYFLDAIESRQAGSAIFDLTIFGATSPVPALLQWTSMLSLTGFAWVFVWQRRASRFANPMLAGVALAAILVAGEGLARVAAVAFPSTKGFPTYASDLWDRRYVQRNALGFRDIEHAARAADSARRLLVVGDSYAFGQGLRHMEDRLGERVAQTLSERTGVPWESVNASRGDSHTLTELTFLERGLAFQPDVILLLYVFNDMDYLSPATTRTVLTEQATTLADRFHPVRLGFKNSYLFQELYVRARQLGFGLQSNTQTAGVDSYYDAELLETHLADLERFVSRAREAASIVAIVPFDIRVVHAATARDRYRHFVERGEQYGLPIWSLETAFDNASDLSLSVNRFDRHPNALANQLAATVVAEKLMNALGGNVSLQLTR